MSFLTWVIAWAGALGQPETPALQPQICEVVDRDLYICIIYGEENQVLVAVPLQTESPVWARKLFREKCESLECGRRGELWHRGNFIEERLILEPPPEQLA